MSKYNHIRSTRPTNEEERPKFMPLLRPKDFVKGQYSHGDKRCFTARMMDVFLREEEPYVAAYKEFRLAVMDYLYTHHRDDHAATAEDRCACWNAVAQKLGYKQVNPIMIPWFDQEEIADQTQKETETQN